MKGKRDIFIIISYVMLVAMLPVTLLFSNLIGQKMTEHIHYTMEDSAALCAEMIERQYTSDILLLDGLAMRMSTSLKSDPQEGLARMVSTAERYGMKRICFTTPDGHTITTDGLTVDLQENELLDRVMQGEEFLTTVIEDMIDGGLVNIYFMPVYTEDTHELIGAVSAVYYSETFEDLLSVTAFGGEGYTYIVDRDGNVVIDSDHANSVKDMKNVFTYMEQNRQNLVEISLIKSALRNEESGFFEIDADGKDEFACYMPLRMNDWYVISVVPKDIAEDTKNAVMFSVMLFCVGISLIAVFVVMSIRYSKKEENRLLEKALYVDELTGGRSYAKFCIDSRERLEMQTEKKAVCAFLDLDNFNLVSTLYGNEESDNSIRRIYNLIQGCLGENALISRNNSDQFCIMYFFNEIQELEDSIKRFAKILHKEAKFDTMLRPTLGVYVVEDRSESVGDMVSKARIAHESIKQNSKTFIAYYDESARNARYENRHFEDEMEQALENHEFVPYLQPKYDAQTGKICGAEALIRWVSAEGAIISPGKFIPLAENNGFIRELDREMFSMVCRLQRFFLDKGINPVPISVNVSRQLMYDNTFAEDYYHLMQEMNLPIRLVELEITESAFFEDLDLFKSTLEKLRGYGFRILMDDFGTGYSSLMMLKSVPIDEIKLDKTFIDDYNDEKGRNIIACVLDLAKVMKLPVVAEGVETENQYVYLKEMGCDVIQGYYFSKPLPAENFVQKIYLGQEG